MPLFDFVCNECGHQFERAISYSDAKDLDINLIKCRKCGAIAERQFPVRTKVIYRGSGFHVTDYND